MVTKVLKIEIKKPINIEKSKFYSLMRDIQYQCWKLANKGIRMYWDYQAFDYSYQQRFGKSLKEDNGGCLPNGYKSINSDILNECKNETNALASNCKDAMIRMIEKKWKNDLKDILKGNKSIPNFKRDLPIELHNKQFMNSKKEYRIYDDNGTYSTEINLTNKEYAKEIGLENGNVQLELIVKDNYQKAIVNRLINKEYKLSMSKMSYDKNKKKWFLLLTYSFEAKKEKLEENRILGVDLGVNQPAVCSISDNKYFYKFIGNAEEVRMFEQQVYNRKKRLQKARVWSGEGNIGHGTKKRIQSLEKIGNKISNFKSTKNHCWAREIINIALSEKCGIIQLEDLSGISENNTFLKRWTFFDLQEKIINKANEVGIQVIKINPQYTSARCNHCGFIHLGDKSKWRPNQESFVCQNCNHKANADINASRNIAMNNIEKIILEQIELQSKYSNHIQKYELE